jgi:hypothetical protein
MPKRFDRETGEQLFCLMVSTKSDGSSSYQLFADFEKAKELASSISATYVPSLYESVVCAPEQLRIQDSPAQCNCTRT